MFSYLKIIITTTAASPTAIEPRRLDCIFPAPLLLVAVAPDEIVLVVALVTDAADVNLGVVVGGEPVWVADRDLVELETSVVLTAVAEGAEEPEVHWSPSPVKTVPLSDNTLFALGGHHTKIFALASK